MRWRRLSCNNRLASEPLFGSTAFSNFSSTDKKGITVHSPRYELDVLGKEHEARDKGVRQVPRAIRPQVSPLPQATVDPGGRKRKCDTNAAGCGECAKKGEQCVRPSAPDGRSAAPTLRGHVDALLQHVEHLESENALLKAQVAFLQTERDAVYQASGTMSLPTNDCSVSYAYPFTKE